MNSSGRDDVLQALADLAELLRRPRRRRRRTGRRAPRHLGGLDVEAVGVGVRRQLQHALVDQPVERLGRRHVAQVEQHLVPEPRVQQVQHGVLDAADVQLDAAERTVGVRAHPVVLDLGVDQPLGVGRIQVAQLVPARAGPVRHRVRLAAVLSSGRRPGPARRSTQSVSRPSGGSGVESASSGGNDFGEKSSVSGSSTGSIDSGTAIGRPGLVVDDRERLAPVPLPARTASRAAGRSPRRGRARPPPATR